jgi:hypothetical protein
VRSRTRANYQRRQIPLHLCADERSAPLYRCELKGQTGRDGVAADRLIANLSAQAPDETLSSHTSWGVNRDCPYHRTDRCRRPTDIQEGTACTTDEQQDEAGCWVATDDLKPTSEGILVERTSR